MPKTTNPSGVGSLGTARRWMVTIFDENWSPADVDLHRVAFMVGQNEVCPTTGRKHKQCYVVMKNPVRFTGVKAGIASESAHVIRCNGEHEQCKNYCLKEESRDGDGRQFVLGDENRCGQGARTDHTDAALIVRDQGVGTLLSEDPGYCIKYAGHVAKFEQMVREHIADGQSCREVRAIFVQGNAGVGKTWGAYKVSNNGIFTLQKHATGWWFDGYDPIKHHTLLVDDYNQGDMDRNMILTLTDRWIKNWGVKGSSVKGIWDTVIFTSNWGFNTCFGPDPAVERRFEWIISNVASPFWFFDVLAIVQDYESALGLASDTGNPDWVVNRTVYKMTTDPMYMGPVIRKPKTKIPEVIDDDPLPPPSVDAMPPHSVYLERAQALADMCQGVLTAGDNNTFFSDAINMVHKV